MMRLLWFSLLLSALLAAQVPTTLTAEKEAALGRQMAADFERRFPPVDNPERQAYVDRLGERLAAQMPGISFRFRLIAGDGCGAGYEPAALRGGAVFVPMGLFTAARDESEFAGMLAHAMEHVARRHGMGTATGASIPLLYVGPMCGGEIPMGMRAAWEANELEADRLAMEAMAGAGFDPRALERLLARVRPVPEKRLAGLRAAGR